jgi:hypothetical protein
MFIFLRLRRWRGETLYRVWLEDVVAMRDFASAQGELIELPEDPAATTHNSKMDVEVIVCRWVI